MSLEGRVVSSRDVNEILLCIDPHDALDDPISRGEGTHELGGFSASVGYICVEIQMTESSSFAGEQEGKTSSGASEIGIRFRGIVIVVIVILGGDGQGERSHHVMEIDPDVGSFLEQYLVC